MTAKFTTAQRVLYVQYTNPAAYPPLEHSSRILADSGWQVLFLGTGALGADTLRFSPHPKITVRQLSFQSGGWRQKLHYAWFALWVLAWTLRWRPTWVYASDHLVSPVALLLSYLPGIKVLYQEHDTPAAVPTITFLGLCMWARQRLVQRARLCVLPNKHRTERFARNIADGRPVLTVWNCSSREEVVPPREAPSGDILTVLYHGSIVSPRFPPTVLTALSMLPEKVQLRVIGYETISHTGYVRRLEEMAFQLGISQRVEFVGPVPLRSELLERCQQCDVGLTFMPNHARDINLRHMTGASNKPFDYLACGLALLVSDLPDWRAMYVEPGYGLACDPDTPESIAAGIRWFVEHPEEMRAMGERGRQRILAEWNYEKQFSPVLERLDGGVG